MQHRNLARRIPDMNNVDNAKKKDLDVILEKRAVWQ